MVAPPSDSSLGATWIGPAYQAARLRLLIVAQREPSDVGFTPRVGQSFDAALVAKYIDGSMKHQLFTDVARLVLGEAAERAACEKLWSSVAFANLGSGSKKERGRALVTSLDWEGARAHFEALVAELTPTAVLVLGDELGRELTREEGSLEERYGVPVAFAPHPGTEGFAFRDHVKRVAMLRSG